jgi:hypothetical protein
MEGELSFFGILRIMLLWLTPFVFLEGVFLMLFKPEKQQKLEEFLSRKVGLRQRMVPQIEKNIYTFHNWLMHKTPILGIIFIVYSICLFAVLIKV